LPNKGVGMIFRPQNGQDRELSCEADFCGNPRTETAHVDDSSSKLRTRYLTIYHKYPVTRAFQDADRNGTYYIHVYAMTISKGFLRKYRSRT